MWPPSNRIPQEGWGRYIFHAIFRVQPGDLDKVPVGAKGQEGIEKTGWRKQGRKTAAGNIERTDWN